MPAKYTMRMAEKQELPKPTHPMAEWGKDHWNTFAYIESICVDYPDGIGKPDHRSIQCNTNRHPGLVTMHPFTGKPREGANYGIRLKDKTLPGPDYDEWDCIDDMAAEGLVRNVGTGLYPQYTMTDKGCEMAAKLRKHKSNGGQFSNFDVSKENENQ